MAEPYLVLFRPMGKFFFGTSQSFGEGFHAHSRRFPSQITILGCLRRTLLRDNECLTDDGRRPDFKQYGEDILSLTGTSQDFSPNDPKPDYGIIKKISPVCITHWPRKSSCPDDFLFPVPRDVDINYKKPAEGKKEPVGFTMIEPEKKEPEGKAFVRGREVTVDYQSTRDIKKIRTEYLGGRDFWKAYQSGKLDTVRPSECNKMDKIIVPSDQMGIARRERQTVDKGFYRKFDYSLKAGYCFAVIAHLKREELEDGDVILGGERSVFRMSIHPLKGEWITCIDEHPILSRFKNTSVVSEGSEDIPDGEKWVCVSSYLAEGEIGELEHANIGGIEALRGLRYDSTRKDKVYTNTWRTLPAGSVLYPKAGDPLPRCPQAERIGFNCILKAAKGDSHAV